MWGHFAALSCDRSGYFFSQASGHFAAIFLAPKEWFLGRCEDMLQPSLWHFSKTSGRFAAIFLATNVGTFFAGCEEILQPFLVTKADGFFLCDSCHRSGYFKSRQRDILLPSLLRQQQLFFWQQHCSFLLKPLYAPNSNQVISQPCQSINLKCRDSESVICRNKPTFTLAIRFDLCHYGSRLPF